jgi:hypothetical protein
MFVLHVQHEVESYERWREIFDKDPLDRAGSGSRRYRVMRPASDEKFVIVDLEFDDRKQAESFGKRLNALWDRMEFEQEDRLLHDPRVRVYEVVETREVGA